MKKQLYTFALIALSSLSACDKEEDIKIILDSTSHQIQIPLYTQPDVTETRMKHGQLQEVTLDYNRQVFVDLDASTESAGADTLGVHYSDDSFVKFDVTADTPIDTAEGFDGWDIVITEYKGWTPDGQGGLTPYHMTGALLNKGVTKAVKVTEETVDTFTAFADLSFEDAESIVLSADVDVIGSGWKKLNFSTFTYDIVANQYYIVESTDGSIFKLQFTDFYSDDAEGKGGFPKFSYQRLVAAE